MLGAGKVFFAWCWKRFMTDLRQHTKILKVGFIRVVTILNSIDSNCGEATK